LIAKIKFVVFVGFESDIYQFFSIVFMISGLETLNDHVMQKCHFDSVLGFALIILSCIIYGMAFDFFNISGALFVEKNTDSSIQSSAQGLFMLMTNGIGAVVGNIVAGLVIQKLFEDPVTTRLVIQKWFEDPVIGLVIQKWFEDPVTHVKDWTGIWLTFAAYALVVAIVFAIVFKYKHDPNEEFEVKH
jgi:NHS family xanthosine MFS transporter